MEASGKKPAHDLIPELKAGNGGRDIPIDEWRSIIGSYEHCVAYGTLFWPDFVEYEDCVFFDHGNGAASMANNYKGFMAQTNGDKAAVEAVMNHRHILDLFPNAKQEASREMILYVGRLLKEMWQVKLDRDFPNRKITVSFPDDHADDLLAYEITFFQEEHLR